VIGNVRALSSFDSTENTDAVSMDKITGRLMDCFEVGPHLVGSRASVSVDPLRGGYILVDQHPHIGIVELPVVHAIWIDVRVGALDTALDVALGISTTEEQVHQFGPASPVLLLLVQSLVDPRDSR